MARPVPELVARLGFDPAIAPELWQQALTHSSAEGQPHYERLEYLGDAVLKLVVSQWLYAGHPELNEGAMSKARADVVSDATLAEVAKRMELGDHLILGPAEKRSHGRTKVGILASSFEALIGVVYLTHGYEAMSTFLEGWLGAELAGALARGGRGNFKAVLQEYSQKRYKRVPEYRLLAEIGPEHDRSYDVEVFVEGERLGIGRGRSKKMAEQKAAEQALVALGEGDAAPESA